MEQNKITCFCCHGDETELDALIAVGNDNYICDACSDQIHELFALRKQHQKSVNRKKSPMYPKQIKHQLDETVIGQEAAKKVLSVEIFNHYKRINNPDLQVQKSNILMIGDSGTGKTLLVQTLAKMLDLPFVIADMSLVTASGYVGQDVESFLQQLVIAADNDIAKAQHGIVMLDEVDKIAKRNLTSSAEKDPSGEGVQQCLLKILEGSKVKLNVDGIKSKDSYIDTSNILFICAGAFFGLDKVIEKNHSSDTTSIGFSADINKSDFQNIPINEHDIIEYGFIPEFVGRLPVMVQLQKLTRNDYRRILTEPKNCIINQYVELMKIDNIKLEFSEQFFDEVIDEVEKTRRGARALRSIIENKLREIIYEIDENNEGQTIHL